MSKELVYPPVSSNHFKAYQKWMQRNEKSSRTIKQYLSCLNRMLNLDIDSYLADPETTDKRNLICAYRSYIKTRVGKTMALKSVFEEKEGKFLDF